jgi:hypothetical protein
MKALIQTTKQGIYLVKGSARLKAETSTPYLKGFNDALKRGIEKTPTQPMRIATSTASATTPESPNTAAKITPKNSKPNLAPQKITGTIPHNQPLNFPDSSPPSRPPGKIFILRHSIT